MADVVNHLKGKDVGISISTNLVTPAYKLAVCRINGGLSGTRDVQTQSTTCGVSKSAGEPNYTITGSIMVNTSPGGSELSHEELIALFDSGDDFLFKVEHSTPADYYRQGTGFLSNYSETYNDGENVLAEFTIEVQGTIDVTSA